MWASKIAEDWEAKSPAVDKATFHSSDAQKGPRVEISVFSCRWEQMEEVIRCCCRVARGYLGSSSNRLVKGVQKHPFFFAIATP